MPGILIIAHAPLAGTLCACAAHVFGALPQRLEGLDVPAEADVQSVLRQASAAMSRLAATDGEVLVLADAAGATPCNTACRLLPAAAGSARVRLLGGVNLPMLLRALCYQHEALDQLVSRAIEGGRRAIAEIDPGAPDALPAQPAPALQTACAGPGATPPCPGSSC